MSCTERSLLPPEMQQLPDLALGLQQLAGYPPDSRAVVVLCKYFMICFLCAPKYQSLISDIVNILSVKQLWPHYVGTCSLTLEYSYHLIAM